MKYSRFSLRCSALLLCVLTSLLSLASCRGGGPEPEVTLSVTTPAGNGTVQAETYASGESHAPADSRPSGESAPSDGNHPDGSTSGRLSSTSGTKLNLLLDWVRTPGKDADTLTVTVRLSSYSLSVSERPNLGHLTVGGETVNFSTEPISIADNSAPTLTDLYTHTFSVPSGKTVSLSASWPFNGTYAGVEIGTLCVEGNIA